LSLPGCRRRGRIGFGFQEIFKIVMAGHSRLKDGVASARLCPAIHVFLVAAP
jgi:hypothetical protein